MLTDCNAGAAHPVPTVPVAPRPPGRQARLPRQRVLTHTGRGANIQVRIDFVTATRYVTVHLHILFMTSLSSVAYRIRTQLLCLMILSQIRIYILSFDGNFCLTQSFRVDKKHFSGTKFLGSHVTSICF